MVIVFSFCHADADMAMANAQWLSKLQIGSHHECVSLCNFQARDERLHEPIFAELQKTFKVVHQAFCTEDERLWPEEQRKWPWGPNLNFTSAARFIRDNIKKRWLLYEVDAIALHDGWLDEIEGEDLRAAKPFFGMLVDTKSPQTGERIPVHMSGIGVYPPDLQKYTDTALQGGGIAFDMVLGPVTTMNMADTRLIHHHYGAPEITTIEGLRQIKPGAAIFHNQQTPAIFQILAQVQGKQNQELVPAPAPKASPRALSAQPRATSMTTDIFLKAYPKDYGWAMYCLRSIQRYCSGFRQVVIVAPDATLEVPYGLSTHVHVEPDKEPGYLWQQSVKCHADRYTDADQILFVDCDCVFKMPVTPETFMRGGKPIWLKTPWKHVHDLNAQEAWIPAMRAWAGFTPDFEYMRRHPALVPAWLLKGMREFTTFLHAKPLEQYIMESGSFTEFNCMGLYADLKHRDKFHWIDTSKDEVPPETLKQFYSHDGLDAETVAEIEALLGAEHAAPKLVDLGAQLLRFEPAPFPHNMGEIPGIKDPVEMAIKTLSSEASKSGLHKARLAKQLVAAGVIAEPKKKGRKK